MRLEEFDVMELESDDVLQGFGGLVVAQRVRLDAHGVPRVLLLRPRHVLAQDPRHLEQRGAGGRGGKEPSTGQTLGHGGLLGVLRAAKVSCGGLAAAAPPRLRPPRQRIVATGAQWRQGLWSLVAGSLQTPTPPEPRAEHIPEIFSIPPRVPSSAGV
jgi:hypothetical protein